MTYFGKRVAALVTSLALATTMNPIVAVAEVSSEAYPSSVSSTSETPRVEGASSIGEGADTQVEAQPTQNGGIAGETTSAGAGDELPAEDATAPETTDPDKQQVAVNGAEEKSAETDADNAGNAAEDAEADRDNSSKSDDETTTDEEVDESLYEGIDTSLFAATVDEVGVWKRIWGQNAYDTMQAILRTDGEFADNSGGAVIIATGEGYWDALAASGLAGLHQAPVIITEAGKLSAQAKAEIARIKPKNIYVMGGTVAITQACYDEINALCPKGTTRVQGLTAPETAVAIYQAGSGWGKTAVVATCDGYWDALSIAPFAYARTAPIFLTNSSDSADGRVLSDNVLAAIKQGGFERVIIVGGNVAVSSKVEQQLAGIGLSGDHVQRKAGEVALDTSAEIAKWEVASEGMSVESLCVATSKGYWDALTGAALAGKQNAALVLVNPDGDYRALDAVYHYDEAVQNGHVFGGPAAIHDRTFERISSSFYVEGLVASPGASKLGSPIKLTATLGGNTQGVTCTWEWERIYRDTKGSAAGGTSFDFNPSGAGVYDVTFTAKAPTGEYHVDTITVEFAGTGGTEGDLLAVAREDLGYSMYDDPEQGSKFGRWFAGYTRNPWFGYNGVAYCAMAVSYWCNAAGVPCAGLPSAGCENIYFAAIDAGRFVEKDNLQPGMLILFDWDDDHLPDHIGIVEQRIDEDTFQTLEGNTSIGNAGSQDNGGRVARRERDYNVIVGGVMPDFK